MSARMLSPDLKPVPAMRRALDLLEDVVHPHDNAVEAARLLRSAINQAQFAAKVGPHNGGMVATILGTDHG